MNPHNKQNRFLSMVNKHFSRAAGLVVLAALTGCAMTGPQQATVPLFYPPLPNPPRIQYLASFSEARDVAAPPGAFAQFVLGSKSDEADIVKKPYGVAVNQGRIFVVDTRGPAYAVFDLPQQKYQLVMGSAGGRLRKPINITIDQDGSKYITDTDRNQVVVFDKDDRYVRAYGVEEQFKPSDVAIVGNRLFVADLKHHQVHVLDKASGKTLSKFGKPGSAEGEFFHPTNLTVSADNFLYITDTSNYRIQKLTLDGQFVRAYGGIGSGPGQFARPKGVAVDRDGRIYVVDAAFENIQVMDPKGKLLLYFGEPGERRENINLPTAITIDYDSVPYFQKYADPKFKLEYVIAVASQFGNSKVNVYGFGKMEGMDYSVTDQPSPPQQEAR